MVDSEVLKDRNNGPFRRVWCYREPEHHGFGCVIPLEVRHGCFSHPPHYLRLSPMYGRTFGAHLGPNDTRDKSFLAVGERRCWGDEIQLREYLASELLNSRHSQRSLLRVTDRGYGR